MHFQKKLQKEEEPTTLICDMMKEDLTLSNMMTFELSKKKPIHGWFWYKEGYAPEIVERAIKENTKNILDPFCGVGTTLLCAKEKKIDSIGVDASPLAVFASKVKTEDYSEKDKEDILSFLRKEKRETKYNWEFELFSPLAAFPKRNYNQILSLRESMEDEEPKVRNLLLLGLISILPQASLVLKDGGVLKIRNDKRALPAKEIFKRKIKKMVKELDGAYFGHCPEIYLGDARALDIPSESVDLIVTSPPYLNNIDYSKVYGLELSLLEMSKATAEEVRLRAIRSFIGKNMTIKKIPEEVIDIGERIPIIGTYFKDMEQAICEMYRTLKEGQESHIIISNSVIHENHILVDEIFCKIGSRIGFSETEIIVGASRIADVKPQKIKTRESIVILKK